MAHSGWCVKSGQEPSTHPEAIPALEIGVRDTLATKALLAPCSDSPVLQVHVYDVREEPLGIVANEAAVMARATRVTVVVTGSVHGKSGTQHLGLVEEHYIVAAPSTPSAHHQALETGVVMAARRAGVALVHRLLGEPVLAPDPEGSVWASSNY